MQARAAAEAAISGQPDAGTALPAPVKSKMETAFGVDFSSVRIHEGTGAPALGALAYTQGTDIHFSPGEYRPDSEVGQKLLGHELAHVVQQSSGRVPTSPQAKGAVINSDPALEREADDMGERAARGEQVGGGRSSAPAPMRGAVRQAAMPIQRQLIIGGKPVPESRVAELIAYCKHILAANTIAWTSDMEKALRAMVASRTHGFSVADQKDLPRAVYNRALGKSDAALSIHELRSEFGAELDSAHQRRQEMKFCLHNKPARFQVDEEASKGFSELPKDHIMPPGEGYRWADVKGRRVKFQFDRHSHPDPSYTPTFGDPTNPSYLNYQDSKLLNYRATQAPEQYTAKEMRGDVDKWGFKQPEYAGHHKIKGGTVGHAFEDSKLNLRTIGDPLGWDMRRNPKSEDKPSTIPKDTRWDEGKKRLVPRHPTNPQWPHDVPSYHDNQVERDRYIRKVHTRTSSHPYAFLPENTTQGRHLNRIGFEENSARGDKAYLQHHAYSRRARHHVTPYYNKRTDLSPWAVPKTVYKRSFFNPFEGRSDRESNPKSYDPKATDPKTFTFKFDNHLEANYQKWDAWDSTTGKYPRETNERGDPKNGRYGSLAKDETGERRSTYDYLDRHKVDASEFPGHDIFDSTEMGGYRSDEEEYEEKETYKPKDGSDAPETLPTPFHVPRYLEQRTEWLPGSHIEGEIHTDGSGEKWKIDKARYDHTNHRTECTMSRVDTYRDPFDTTFSVDLSSLKGEI